MFDAICFALYGEASGLYRSKASDYRSTYAKPKTPTFVKYEFEYNKKRYTVTRNPDYVRPKSRGEGMTHETAKAELIMPDGTVVTKVGEVNKQIEELIGLTYSQFTQISMLAQGEFQRLLNADTKDRIEIFRRIFNTQPYQVFQLKLKDRCLAAEREYNEQKRAVEQYIDSIVCGENALLNAKLDELKPSGAFASDSVCEILSQMCEEDNNAQKNLQAKLESVDAEISKLTADIAKADSAEKAKADFKLCEQQLEKLKSDFEQRSADLKKERSNQPQRESILAKAGVLRNELNDYDTLETLVAEGKNVSAKIKTSALKHDKIKEEYIFVSQRLEKSKSELAALDGVNVDLEKAKNRLDGVEEQLRLLKEFEQEFEKLDMYRKKADECKRDYLSAKREYDAAADNYRISESLFFDAQAGILSARLTEGKPCPVCGSHTHPHPAEIPADAPSEKQIKDDKAALDLLLSKLQSASVSAEKANYAYDCQKADVKSKAAEFFDSSADYASDLNNKICDCIKQRDSLSALKSALEERAQKREKLAEVIPTLEKEAEQLKSDASALASEISALNERRSQLLERYSETASRLHCKTKAEAENTLQSLNTEADQIAERLRDAEDNFNKCNELIHRTESKLASLKEQIASIGEYNYRELCDGVNAAQNTRNALRSRKEAVAVRLSANTETLKSIRRKSAEMSDLTERIKSISAVSNTANGTLSKKDKLLFETYIQMTWFDRVIIMANLRFSQMTGGQYRLVRRKSAENRVSQSGLDLDVIDYKNGTQRSVKTLSGGESFMASLSLALGLSDVVQSISGGIHLDAMFIDEGFGSLDDESLSQAVAVLRKLSDGNRSVGIISHVSELKQRIDSQLVVFKDDDGISRVRIDI